MLRKGEMLTQLFLVGDVALAVLKEGTFQPALQSGRAALMEVGRKWTQSPGLRRGRRISGRPTGRETRLRR